MCGCVSVGVLVSTAKNLHQAGKGKRNIVASILYTVAGHEKQCWTIISQQHFRYG